MKPWCLAVAGACASIAASLIGCSAGMAQATGTGAAGKPIRLLIPSGPGGGYDAYGRIVARHIGSHLSGNPVVTAEGMPGGGGIAEANYLAKVAPKDGTVIGILQNNMPLKPILDPRQIKYSLQDFGWLGSVTPVTNIGLVKPGAPVRVASDLLSHELIVGGSGGSTTYVPEMLNRLMHTKFKVVKGYKGSDEVMLAIERGEVEGIVGIAYDSISQSAEAAAVNGKLLFQMGLRRDPMLADVPLIQELAPPAARAVLECVFAAFQIGRIFAAPAGVPAARLEELRKAFADTMADPAFRQDAERLHLGVNPQPAEAIDAIIRSVAQQPATVLGPAREALAAE